MDEKNSTQQFNDPKLLGEELSTITTILEKLVVFQKQEKHSDQYKLSDLKWSVGELQALTNIFKIIITDELEKTQLK